MFRSIKTKIMVMMVIAIVIPLFVVAALSLNQFKVNTEQSVYDKLGDLTEMTADIIEEELSKTEMMVQLLSNEKLYADIARGDESVRKEVFSNLQEEKNDYNHLIESVFITDTKAKGIVSDSEKYFSSDFSDREYLKIALSGTLGLSDVIISKLSGNPVVAVAYPIKEEGRIVGAIVATVPFENITDHVKAIEVFETGYAYMFDLDGLTISHKDPSNEFNLVISDAVPDLKPVVEAVKNGNSGDVSYNWKGVDKYVRYVPVGQWGLAVTADYDDYMATNNSVRNTIFIVGLVAGIIALIVAYIFTTRSVVKPLIHMEELMTLAGEGDLTVAASVKTGDEIERIAKSFNSMIENQHDIVGKVKADAVELSISSDDIAESTNQVSDSSENITKSITQVANNSTEQAKSVGETSEVLIQLSSLIQLAKNRAEAADINVRESLAVADEGRQSIETTIGAMVNIEELSKATNGTLKELEELSTKVKGIIDTINAIADQTNMLALNASIEAARAGEHGRGFAVVAEEVRKLAEQTADESSGISAVVSDMVSKIAEAVDSMDKGNTAVQEGVHRARETDGAFVSIAEAVENMQMDIDKIVQVTDDEVASSNKILKLIDAVAALSEVNSANSQEVAAATEEQTALLETIAAGSEEMTAMAEELKEMVERFKLKGEA